VWTKEKTIAVIVAVAVIVIATVYVVTSQKQNSSGTAQNALNTTPPGQLPLTRQPVPANVSVPNEGDVALAAGVAVPDVQVAAHVIGPQATPICVERRQ